MKTKIEILFLKLELKKFVIIKMLNTCSNAIIIDGIPQSITKISEEHGYGLINVEKIIKEHGGQIKYDFEDEIHTFKTSIIFPSGKDRK